VKQARSWREIDGILLVDKPVGPSSNRVLQMTRRALAARKAGHTGTLDPFASGLLVCCFGEATKISGQLLDAPKEYLAELTLGRATSGADSTGETIATAPVPPLDIAAITAVLASLRGAGEQTPPMYSALKHQGRRLYHLARQGLDVERPPRPVMIYELELLDWQAPRLCFRVQAAKGLYVRTLGETIAERLGTVGHLSALRRTALGPFRVEDAWRPPDDPAAIDVSRLEARLLPPPAALPDYPRVSLSEEQARRLMQGAAVRLPEATAAVAAMALVFDDNGACLGLGEVGVEGLLRPKRLFAHRLKR